MSDSIHDSLSAFRDSILTSIARLEFQLRDVETYTKLKKNVVEENPNEQIQNSLKEITSRMISLELRMNAFCRLNKNAETIRDNSLKRGFTLK